MNYPANIRLLADAGVELVIALNTVGGISENAATEALLLPDQIIDSHFQDLMADPVAAVEKIYGAPAEGEEIAEGDASAETPAP